MRVVIAVISWLNWSVRFEFSLLKECREELYLVLTTNSSLPPVATSQSSTKSLAGQLA